MKEPAGLIFLAMGVWANFRGIRGYRRGKISWLRGPKEFWMAERDSDPVSFTTGVWLHIGVGLLMIWMGYWIALA